LVPAESEIEQDCGRHDWHDAGGRLEADIFFLEVLHDPLRGIETERASARQDDGVNPLDEVRRIEEVRLARTRSTAALRDTADRAVTVREHDSAAAQTSGQRHMTNSDARHP